MNLYESNNSFVCKIFLSFRIFNDSSVTVILTTTLSKKVSMLKEKKLKKKSFGSALEILKWLKTEIGGKSPFVGKAILA